MSIKTTRDVIREVCKATCLTNKGRLAIRAPVGSFIKGYVFDSSGFSKTSFYVNVFIHPTYTPADSIYLTYGGRLKNAAGLRGFELDLEEPQSTLKECLNAIQNQGEDFLNRVHTVLDFAKLSESAPHIGDIRWTKDDINVLETRAYSWALAGRISEAIANLRQIEETLTKKPDDREWVLDLRERARGMKSRLSSGNVAEFRSILGGWRERLLAKERLSDVAQPTTPELT